MLLEDGKLWREKSSEHIFSETKLAVGSGSAVQSTLRGPISEGHFMLSEETHSTPPVPLGISKVQIYCSGNACGIGNKRL